MRDPCSALARKFASPYSPSTPCDTPERLKLYAEGHGLDAGRWTLLTADDDALRELAQALGIAYRRNGGTASTIRR